LFSSLPATPMIGNIGLHLCLSIGDRLSSLR
jgi:hypothetical protein